MNVGKDVTWDVVTSAGLMTIDITTSFHAKPAYTEVSSKAVDGKTRKAYIPNGHDITIKLDRAGPDVEDFFTQAEADYFDGLPLQSGSITETVQEPDGSVSQYRYEEVILKLDDTGERSGDKLIQMSIAGHATRKKQVA
jgi:hypothetical protein